MCPECKDIWEQMKPEAARRRRLGQSGPGRVTGRPDAIHPSPVLTPAWPDRAAWGTAPSLRAWQQAAMDKYAATLPA